MHLEPFVRVDAMPFSASEAEVRAAHGKPLKTGRNGIGLNELDYGGVVYRFQDSGRLEEITLQSPLTFIGQAAVPFGALAAYVQSQDAGHFERGDFLVSPRFGIAFDPDAATPWVTALAAHCLDAWRAL